MPVIAFPYGKETLSFDIPDHRFRGALVPRLHAGGDGPRKSGEALADDALANPVGTPPLHVLAEGKKKAVIIASDHTRPVPSKIIIPRMLAEIRRGNPGADITILVATGCHRETTAAELEDKFGSDIMKGENILVHDCDSPDMVRLGTLPSGGELVLNRTAAEADLLAAEGFIEPHFFAGFSGGGKSVLPGVAGRKTVVYNHNAEFIAHPRARTGVLEGNPIRIDILYAARAARLAFICNVVIDANKKIIHAAAGDCDLAHREGAAFLSTGCGVNAVPSDIVIAANGGYPLDQNIYQAVKGMTAAEAAVRKGGVIIMIAKSNDGHGAPEFYRIFAEEKDLDRMLDLFMKTPKEQTRVDQWQSQIFARVLKRARVVYVSDAPDAMVRDLHMTPAHSVEAALKIAEGFLENPEASVAAIPDGVAVMVRRAAG
ncbi:MAG: nickel-dependent lactate racemase [Treponema sp.]|jgi:nickel-dependent lactate racemase|nr:nickel-dependent lactate racemase [Treponema sp.]